MNTLLTEGMSFIAANGVAIVTLILAGLIAGVAAGLFGIGGGAIIVPLLYFLLSAAGYTEWAMHVAVATSLATIIATSVRSVLAHNKRGAVDWNILREWAPWIVIGAILGGFLTRYIDAQGMTAIFGSVALLIAAQLIFGRPTWAFGDHLPNGPLRAGVGTALGTCSAIMGIGGGTFGVTLLTLFKRPMHTAVATAAGFGVAIGGPGALGAIIAGWGAENVPPGSLGFVNIPAFFLIAICTVSMAPLGAKLAHKLNAEVLRRSFGVFLALVAIRMLLKVFA